MTIESDSVAFSSDGARMLTVSGNAARVWDAVTGEAIGQPMKHEGSVSSALFSPDGLRVVTASDDKTARVWDATTGAPIGKPLQHDDQVRSAAFSPDGARVVTVSPDAARLWDAATGAPMGRPFHGYVNSAALSPDGTRVATASDDMTARIWNVPPPAPNIIATACKMLGANHDTTGLLTRYGIGIKDPICTGNEPAPDPSLVTEH